jgi:hypothetical protein
VQRDLAAANDHYEAAVSAEITRRLEDLDRRQEGIGLLERFGALHELISENWFLFLARWFLTGFFVLIDCLPVFVKLFGGITFYERLLHDRLTAAEQVFNEDTRTGAAEQIVKARTRRYQAEVQEQTSRDDIDHRGRITAAHREAELDQETAKLIEQYRAQHRTDHQGDDANGQTRAGMGEPRGLG